MRRYHWVLAVVFAGLSTGGCAMGAADDFEETGTIDEAFTRPSLGETPTVPTLCSEAGLWGDSLTRTLQPSGDNESISLINKTDLGNANLLHRVSSLRLKCGSRSSQITLFSAQNAGTTMSSWSKTDPGRPVYCEPNQTVTMNLHWEASQLADNVGSVYMLRHTRKAESIPFSMVLTNSWNTAMEDLPSGATATGEPTLELESSYRFKLRQNFKLDSTWRAERGAHFVLTVQMYGNGDFNPYVSST